jgi:pimeloyl-ACP methyl ester carboxylesterase
MKRKFTRIGLVILALLLIFVAGFVAWASAAAGPAETALIALQSGDGVTVTAWQGGYSFRPEGQQPDTGLIFYPGGRVDFRSYAPALRLIAAAGYEVVLVRVPLNLAVFNPGAAAAAIEAYPGISRWAVGGHSLGGSMAAWYAHDNLDQINGLVLWASYPADSNDFSGTNLPVLSIYGTNDGVAAPERVTAAKNLLPVDTRWGAIDGGNHAQFGDYGEQAGDGQAAISPEQQWVQTAQATIAFLQQIGR